jgi:hypothetical protein
MSATKAATISECNYTQSGENEKICDILQNEIDKELKEATSNIRRWT